MCWLVLDHLMSIDHSLVLVKAAKVTLVQNKNVIIEEHVVVQLYAAHLVLNILLAGHCLDKMCGAYRLS